MLDFGQFNFGQLAEIEIGRSRNWPMSTALAPATHCLFSFFFSFFFFLFFFTPNFEARLQSSNLKSGFKVQTWEFGTSLGTPWSHPPSQGVFGLSWCSSGRARRVGSPKRGPKITRFFSSLKCPRLESPNVAFEGPGLQKHHQNSMKGPQEREEIKKIVAGEGKKSEMFAGPAGGGGVRQRGSSGRGVGRMGVGRSLGASKKKASNGFKVGRGGGASRLSEGGASEGTC